MAVDRDGGRGAGEGVPRMLNIRNGSVPCPMSPLYRFNFKKCPCQIKSLTPRYRIVSADWSTTNKDTF